MARAPRKGKDGAGGARKKPAATRRKTRGTRRKGAARPGGGAKDAGPAAELPTTETAPPLTRLTDLVGNARPRRLLMQAVAQGRLRPALLFHGPPGVGKFTAARAVAAALNCGAPEGGDACAACVSCRKVAAWAHPDVKVLESEAEARRAGRPVFFAEPGGGGRASTRLLVGQVRRLLRETDFRPFEGRRRVVLVRHLESDPSHGCANALLKALEEPPSGTVFILTSARPERLPATVRSRCLALAFLPASRDELAAFLRGRGLPDQEASLRASLSGGRPGAAMDLDAEGGLRLRDAGLQALAAAAGGEPLAALAAADALTPAPDELAELLSCLALIARDLMIWADGPGGALLVNVDRRADLEALAGRIPQARAARLRESIAWCQQAAERNVNPALMLQVLMLEAGGHLAASPLSVPWLEGEGRP